MLILWLLILFSYSGGPVWDIKLKLISSKVGVYQRACALPYDNAYLYNECSSWCLHASRHVLLRSKVLDCYRRVSLLL